MNYMLYVRETFFAKAVRARIRRWNSLTHYRLNHVLSRHHSLKFPKVTLWCAMDRGLTKRLLLSLVKLCDSGCPGRSYFFKDRSIDRKETCHQLIAHANRLSHIDDGQQIEYTRGGWLGRRRRRRRSGDTFKSE